MLLKSTSTCSKYFLCCKWSDWGYGKLTHTIEQYEFLGYCFCWGGDITWQVLAWRVYFREQITNTYKEHEEI